MRTTELGRTGVHIPVIGMGTSEYLGGSRPLRSGLEHGATLIDTAESYGTEMQVGPATEDRRDRAFIATKVSAERFARDDLLAAVGESLARLRTDTIDLYQLHWPSSTVPIEQTMATMDELVDRGTVRFIGVCNFSVEQLEAAQAASRHPVVSNQVPYSLIDRGIEDELLPWCRDHGVTVIAYSPLARDLETLEAGLAPGVLEQVAREVGATKAQVALAWCIRSPGVVAIPKSRHVERVIENCGAAEVSLSPEQIARLEQPP